jgi:hypothetical protein
MVSLLADKVPYIGKDYLEPLFKHAENAIATGVIAIGGKVFLDYTKALADNKPYTHAANLQNFGYVAAAYYVAKLATDYVINKFFQAKQGDINDAVKNEFCSIVGAAKAAEVVGTVLKVTVYFQNALLSFPAAYMGENAANKLREGLKSLF